MGACTPKPLVNGLHVTVSLQPPFSLQTFPAPECSFHSLSGQGSQWPQRGRAGSGCGTSAPGQDGAPGWKADSSHHTTLGSLRRKLSTTCSEVRGSGSLLGRRSRLGGHGAMRLVLQGHTGPSLLRLNIWRGTKIPWGHCHRQACGQEARAPSSSLNTPVIQHLPSPDLRFLV